MSKISKKLTTNARILKDVLTHYSSTFNAFKELINNSLQAHARNIYIELRASECDEDSVLQRCPLFIEWPELVEELLPEDAVKVEISH